MSRIGKIPVELPSGVTHVLADGSLRVQGPKGTLSMGMPSGISLKAEGQTVEVHADGGGKKMDALSGLVRATFDNMVKGVTVGWSKTLELSGVGYRAALSGANIVLTVGYSHSVTVEPPAGITFAITEGKIVVTGIDKQMVGQTAAKIRSIKKPEPYKGKGIKYAGERIRKKAGKTAKAVGGGK